MNTARKRFVAPIGEATPLLNVAKRSKRRKNSDIGLLPPWRDSALNLRAVGPRFPNPASSILDGHVRGNTAALASLGAYFTRPISMTPSLS
jgi:hypothetical protein